MTPIYRDEFHLAFENKLLTDEIAMRVNFSQTKMIIWLFHATIKKQIINA